MGRGGERKIRKKMNKLQETLMENRVLLTPKYDFFGILISLSWLNLAVHFPLLPIQFHSFTFTQQ